MFCSTPIANISERGFIVAFDSAPDNVTCSFIADGGSVDLVRNGSNTCYFANVWGDYFTMLIAGQTPKYFIVFKMTVG